MTTWTVLIPFKGSALGKSRLTSATLSDAHRRELATAFLRDVVDVALHTPEVARVIVTSPDAHTKQLLGELPCDVLIEPPHISGLNAGVLWALRELGAPHLACAVLTSDLPYLREHELSQALNLASGRERSMTTDREGTGTTMLLANRTPEFEPAFGISSRLAHERLGFALLNVPSSSGLRHDVDTSEQLRQAGNLVAGRHTSSVLKAIAAAPHDARLTRE